MREFTSPIKMNDHWQLTESRRVLRINLCCISLKLLVAPLVSGNTMPQLLPFTNNVYHSNTHINPVITSVMTLHTKSGISIVLSLLNQMNLYFYIYLNNIWISWMHISIKSRNWISAIKTSIMFSICRSPYRQIENAESIVGSHQNPK